MLLFALYSDKYSAREDMFSFYPKPILPWPEASRQLLLQSKPKKIASSAWLQLVTAQSLTTALSSLGQFKVRVNYLGERRLSKREALGEEVPLIVYFVREVELQLNNISVVCARSVVSPTSRDWRQFLDYGSRPLGEKIFQRGIIRNPIRYGTICSATHPWWRVARQYHRENISSLLVRQSAFFRKKDVQKQEAPHVLLSECFLPSLTLFLPSARLFF